MREMEAMVSTVLGAIERVVKQQLLSIWFKSNPNKWGEIIIYCGPTHDFMISIIRINDIINSVYLMISINRFNDIINSIY